MTTTKELADALLAMAAKARDGQADAAQAGVLCSCTDALIRLTRLTMDVQFQSANGQHYRLPWIKEDAAAQGAARPEIGKPASPRVVQLQAELAEVEAELAGGELTPEQRSHLNKRRAFIMDRLAHFAAEA